ncbi:hypothetical protein M514_07166 [Trichuris suis]|uniref:Uncharacterized protein n=1 Tax=Trichuris suis TaxID=68888 RepID=A0A085NPF3_9BILA|nr:hypothetical protein M514_07166 [Trichuris suis]
MVGKHSCQRRTKDIDVNFNVLVVRTGKETGTHLGRDEPELCGLVAAKAPAIEKQGYDYSTLKLLAELYDAMKRTDTPLDPEGQQRANVLNNVGKIYLKTQGWKALTNGKVVRVTDNLDELRRQVAELQKTVAETKDRQVQKAVTTLSKLTETHVSATLEELSDIYRGIGKGVRIRNDEVKNVIRQLSKQGIMAPEETSLVSKTVTSGKPEGSTPAQIVQVVAPGVITRQDGTVKTRSKLMNIGKLPPEVISQLLNHKNEFQFSLAAGCCGEERTKQARVLSCHAAKVVDKPKVANAPEVPASSSKKKAIPKKESSKKAKPETTKSASSQSNTTTSTSRTSSQKRSLERVSSMLGIKSGDRSAKSLAQDLQFQPATTGDEKNDQFLIVLNLLEDVESKNRPFSGLELKFVTEAAFSVERVRNVIENETTVPLDKVQLALNEAADQKLITPAQANKAFMDLSREVIKGTGNVPLTKVRKLFDGIMPAK